MSKVKYYFDAETLSYRPIKATNINRVINFLLFVLSSFSFGLICLLILLNSDILNTLLRLHKKRTIQNYELQFDILNKKLSQLESVVANEEEIIIYIVFILKLALYLRSKGTLVLVELTDTEI